MNHNTSNRTCKHGFHLRHSGNSGFTLIEVLIAIVILSIGLLGMAGIQMSGLRGTHDSALRSQATILANDLAERIHVNPGGVFVASTLADRTNTHYAEISSRPIEGNNNGIDCVNDALPAAMCGATVGTAAEVCTPAQMAEFDIFEMACGLDRNSGINNLLPNGRIQVTCSDQVNNCAPGSTLNITITWDEIDQNAQQGNANNTTQKTLTMVIAP